jgi:uncharacterized membrane protein YgdD (TMEM256/DUF423 family)
MKTWLAVAAINGFLAVAAGAFGAHALQGRIDAHDLVVFETGARYQMYHALPSDLQCFLFAGPRARSSPALCSFSALSCFPARCMRSR